MSLPTLDGAHCDMTLKQTELYWNGLSHSGLACFCRRGGRRGGGAQQEEDEQKRRRRARGGGEEEEQANRSLNQTVNGLREWE